MPVSNKKPSVKEPPLSKLNVSIAISRKSSIFWLVLHTWLISFAEEWGVPNKA